MVTVTLLMVHVYFALRPEKLWLTRSMIVGWITPEEYADQHDPERWTVGRRLGQKRQGAAGRVGRTPDLRSSPPS
jgi:hypothetical protein